MNARLSSSPVVDIWIARQDLASGSDALALLTDDEILRMQSFRSELARSAFVNGRLLARLGLSRRLDQAPRSFIFRVGAYGRPELRDAPLGEPVHFSISHTRGLVVCAIADQPVGIDVECQARELDLAALAPACLSDLELQALRAQPPATQKSRFLRLWTLKEAYAKGLGLGLHKPFTSFSIDVDLTPPHLQHDAQASSAPWRLRLLTLGPDHVGALATCGPRQVTLRQHEARPGQGFG